MSHLFAYPSRSLLGVAPLITSTASLMYAHDQDLFFRAFLDGKYRTKADNLLPPWMGVCLRRAFKIIGILYPSTILLALANTNIFTGRWDDGTIFYWAGLAFTVAHFAYGKTALRLLDRIQNDATNGNATSDMRAWLNMNLMRSLSVDLPGWLCFLLAVNAGLDGK